MYNTYDNVVRHIAEVIGKYIIDSKLITKEVEQREVTEYIIKYFEEPPRDEFGDIALPIPRLKSIGVNIKELIKASKDLIKDVKSLSIVKECKLVGPYLNVFINEVEYAKILTNELRLMKDEYGLVKTSSPQRVVVEFISANPIHPLHIGSGRNAALGDFIARILEVTGNKVERRYYINDLGLQVAYLTYGYRLLGRPNPPKNMKMDHFLGLIYAATTTIVDIKSMKEEAERLKESGRVEEYSELMNQINALVADLERIREKVPNVVDELISKISSDPNPKESVNEIMRKYEAGDEEITSLVREVVSKVMQGIRETLEQLGIEINVWDWESDLIRSGLVKEILDKAKASPYVTIHKGALALDFTPVLEDPSIRELLRIPKSMEIPPLILVRSDGTTLYTTRDIAYTIKKFKEFKADKVINVIAIEQTLPQAQLRLALYVLGYVKEAINTIHYSYEMVNLPGMSMSSRRGRYVTIDELLNNLKESTRALMMERGVDADEELLTKVARSAFKYMMLATSPNKVVVFDTNKALDISSNSAPYLQYTYARANGVLTKYGKDIAWDRISFNAFSEGLRRKLLMQIGKFPNVIKYVSTYLHPEDLIAYLNKVADTFNSWYDREPIIKEPNEGVRNAKLMLTYGVKVVMGNGLKVLGIDVLERI